jgi:hypothetical protein
VVIVPGFLAECVAEKSTAFGDARGRLEEIGYQTDYIQTRGRQGSAGNADLIRDAVVGMPAGDRLLFVTHSKGTVDTLRADCGGRERLRGGQRLPFSGCVPGVFGEACP